MLDENEMYRTKNRFPKGVNFKEEEEADYKTEIYSDGLFPESFVEGQKRVVTIVDKMNQKISTQS